MSHILIGDIGGTNIRYQLCYIADNTNNVLKVYNYPASEYKTNLIGSMIDFLQDQPLPDLAVFGITGNVRKNKIIVSYQYGSGLDNIAISKATGISRVYILNDLEASGYGIMTLKDDEAIEINNGHKEDNEPIVCVSIGTGLGQCYLTHSGSNYIVFPAEGGFQEFSPKTDEDRKLYNYIRDRLQKNDLSYFRFLSGCTSQYIYEYLREEYSDLIAKEFDDLFMTSEKDMKTKLVMEAGFSSANPLAIKAVEIWQRILGNLLSNIFVNFLPHGGIYVIGGVISKNHENLLKNNLIIEGYYSSKTKVLRESMHDIPIYIVKSDDLGIRGCLYYAKQQLNR